MRSIVLSLATLLSTNCFAEQFLGIEGASPSSSEPKTITADPGEYGGPDDTTAEVYADDYNDDYSNEAPFPGDWGFSLRGGSTGKDRVAVNASVSYETSRWTHMQLSADYERYESQLSLETVSGGVFYYVLKYTNETMIKPSAGAGPGYLKWQRQTDNIVFSESSSVTANAFWGIGLMFTEHFGLMLQRNWISYFSDPPALFEDNNLKEKRTAVHNTAGFFAVF